MNKITIFNLYHNVANIVEDTFIEIPDLESDTRYVTRVKTIKEGITIIDNVLQVSVLYTWTCKFRDDYPCNSYGYDVFNSIADAILEAIREN